ncbi:hypothetical protein HX881_08325 [Pseudomonas gingeri]|uniref:hypothetical protein n=1 Tax=Pseudomonas gingeri TaxID=117681 RepID=UPI0015A22613|nr:hypothetical protein [Pseudomonas gingeri]NVZ25545.1 hypothetical protein [Pseudomonas gingeri]
MNDPVSDYDPASALEDAPSVAIFMADAFESDDVGYIALALEVVARAKSMAHPARESGRPCERRHR